MNKIKKDYMLIKDQVNGKNGYLSYLLIIIGIIISAYPLSYKYGIYTNFNKIIHDNIFLIFVFIAVGILTYNIITTILDNEFFLIRFKSKMKLDKVIFCSIILSSIIIYIITLFLVCASSILLCLGYVNFTCENWILLLLKDIFDLTVIYLFITLLNLILAQLLVILKNQKLYLILYFLIILSFLLCPHLEVNKIWKIPFIFTWCISKNVLYNSFWIELISILTHCIILIGILFLIIKIKIRRNK